MNALTTIRTITNNPIFIGVVILTTVGAMGAFITSRTSSQTGALFTMFVLAMLLLAFFMGDPPENA